MMRRPIVIIFVEGLSLSSSWAGNVFAHSEPKNFMHLWDNFEHYLIEPDENNVLEECYSKISQNAPASSRMLDLNDLQSNQNLSKALDQAKINNANIDLFVEIDSKKSIEELSLIIRYLRHSGIYSISLHLIIGDRFRDMKHFAEAIFALEAKFDDGRICKIVSLVGRSSLTKPPKHGAKTYLSITQAISNHRAALPSEFPLLIIGTSRPQSDFDFSIFLNQSSKDNLVELAKSVISAKQIKKISQQRYNQFTFAARQFPTPYQDEINFLIENDFSKNIFKQLSSEQYHGLLIAPSTNIQNIKHYLLAGNNQVDEISPSGDLTMFSTLDHALQSDKFDYIILNHTEVSAELASGNLNSALKSIKQLDESLNAISGTILNTDGILILISPFAIAKDNLLGDNSKRSSGIRLPFLIIGKGFEQVSNKSLLVDSLRLSRNYQFISEKLKEIIAIGNRNE